MHRRACATELADELETLGFDTLDDAFGVALDDCCQRGKLSETLRVARAR